MMLVDFETNGGRLTTISRRHALEPQLARIVGDHISRHGHAPACIYVRDSRGLVCWPGPTGAIPIIATGAGYPGADNVALSDDPPPGVPR